MPNEFLITHKMRKEKIKTKEEFIKNNRLSLTGAICHFINERTSFTET